MTGKKATKAPTLSELLHLSRRRNRATVGGGAKTTDVSAAIREMADQDQDELPQARHVQGRFHDLNAALRAALTARNAEGDDDNAA